MMSPRTQRAPCALKTRRATEPLCAVRAPFSRAVSLRQASLLAVGVSLLCASLAAAQTLSASDTPLAPSPPVAQASPAPEPAQKLDVIVVTGTKRSQAQQQATQSVRVLGEGDTLGMQSGFDVFSLVPNVTQQTKTFLPVVRGVDGNGVAAGGGGAVSGAQPRMSNYVDGVARTYGAAPDGSGGFWDMAQVEVYRGSQSTQLGQNSIAGAIIQTTRDPQFKNDAALQVGAHTSGTTYNAAFMVNRQLSEQLAVRITGEGLSGKNAIRYAGFEDKGISAADAGKLGDVDYGRYRMKLLYAPTDALTLKLNLEQERRLNPYTVDGTPNVQRRENIGGILSYFDSTNKIASLSAGWEINREWTLNAIVSDQRANTQFAPPVVGKPDRSKFLDFTFKSDEIAFEPKLIYKATDSRTSAVFGAFVKTRNRTDSGRPGSSFVLAATDDSSTKSIFADATVQLSPDWDLLAAARLEDSEQTRAFSAFDGELTLDFKERNKVFLPKLGITRHFSRDASLSVLAYQGYNAGGGGVSFVSFTPYRYATETSKTIELVARTQWLERRLTANANLFYTQLKNLQVSGIGPEGPFDAIYLNIARARNWGLEIDTAYRVSPELRLNASIGLLNTRIINFGSAANNDNNGNQFALAPRVTASLGGSFDVRPNLRLGVSVSFVGKRFSDYQNVAENQVGQYAIANLNAQWTHKNVIVTGYVNNLFNKFAQLSRAVEENYAYVNDPRTVGVNLRVNFQ